LRGSKYCSLAPATTRLFGFTNYFFTTRLYQQFLQLALPFQKFIDDSSISVGISLFPIVFRTAGGKKGSRYGVLYLSEEGKKRRRVEEEESGGILIKQNSSRQKEEDQANKKMIRAPACRCEQGPNYSKIQIPIMLSVFLPRSFVCIIYPSPSVCFSHPSSVGYSGVLFHGVHVFVAPARGFRDSVSLV
jgi:hypothetical protein